MDRARLAAIATEVRAWEARRLGVSAATFSAIAKTPPKLPGTPKWFDLGKGDIAVSPDCSYQLVVNSLRRAKKSLKVYIYNIAAPYLLDELSAAKNRGIKVQVMFDTMDGGAKEKAELEGRGINCIAAPSAKPVRVFNFCHQKFVVVDDVGILVESANWAGSAIPKRLVTEKYKMGNREWLMWAEDQALSKWFDKLFEHDWKLAMGGGAAGAVFKDDELLTRKTLAYSAIPAIEFSLTKLKKACKVYPLISPNNYTDLLSYLKAAKTSICIQQQYITAGAGVNDLLEVLEQKVKEGIRLRILVSPKFPATWDQSIATLTAANLIGCLKATNLKYVVHCHNKGVLIDDRYAVVSSTNWSESSITKAREAGLLVDSKEVAAYYQQVFDFDWKVGVAPKDVTKTFAVVESADEF